MRLLLYCLLLLVELDVIYDEHDQIRFIERKYRYFLLSYRQRGQAIWRIRSKGERPALK